MLAPVTEQRWELREVSPTRIAPLRPSGYPEPILRIFALRGIETLPELHRFLSGGLSTLSDPFLMPGMAAAARRIARGVVTGETICIYGDYDVDGVTATALLVTFFRELGAPVLWHIPHRIDDGYGLTVSGLENIAARGATLVVTVDCGVTSVEPARACSRLGIDLIITDHHLPDGEIPPAVAVLDPHLPDSPFPAKEIAGVGVAFYLAVAVRKILRDEGFFAACPEPDLKRYLDFVALGTIADVAPVTGENRLLIRHGLPLLNNSSRPGIEALKKVAAVRGEVTCKTVGFSLAPRLNAAGRLEHAEAGLHLLLTDDPLHAQELAATLDEANRQRQELERQILADAIDALTRNGVRKSARSIVLASDEWHPGVIGIVASRLAALYHRPTILISLREGVGKGSGRSIPALHLRDALSACSEHLHAFGGHRQAAGLAIDEGTLALFVERFEEVTSGLLTEEDLCPVLTLDAELSPDLFTADTVDLLNRLVPFGVGNPEPLFLIRGGVIVSLRTVKGGHLRCSVEWCGKRVDGIWFTPPPHSFAPGDRIDLAAHLEMNQWQGKRSLFLRIKGIRRESNAA